MFYHNKCNGPVLLANNQLLILSEFTITQKGIKPTISEIIKINNDKLAVEFTCQVCGEKVNINNIYAYCFNCGDRHTLDDLFKISRHSGYYCNSCFDEYFTEFSKKPLSSLLRYYNTDKGDSE